MHYTEHEFKSGDTLYASQLNEMDAQIIENQDGINALKNAMDILCVATPFTGREHNGVSFTPTQHGFTVSRISEGSATAFVNILNGSLPTGVIPGQKLWLDYTSTSPALAVGILFSDANNTAIGGLQTYNQSAEISVPETAARLILRVQVLKTENPSDDEIAIRLYAPNPALTGSGCLASPGDATDMTSIIMSMLASTKVCNLGPGDFYVSGIDMPDNSILRGSGNATRLILAGTEAGYAIRLGSYGTVEDLSVVGAVKAIAPSASVGNRHGIVWQGDYTATGTSVTQPRYGKISKVYISDFTGGGITCRDTGPSGRNMVHVSDCDIFNCGVGINVSYYSEYNKFSSVKSYKNYYGCINNGGNNTFVNCDFSNNQVGFFINGEDNPDSPDGSSPNSAHGTCTGCLFNHTADNTGVGIKVIGTENGFLFAACQIFFSQIYIGNSSGVVISGCELGSTNSNITISGGNVVLFANNLHKAHPTINISDNEKVRFVNCFVWSTGETVQAQ